jgi:hypothetical protein
VAADKTGPTRTPQQTFVFDIRTRQKNVKLSDAVLERVCSFWNTGRSASCRHAAEARANPRGHTAQVMLASIQPDLHDGSWISLL